jgi:NAD(P)-dependent dehydrogenase (short-subunit alcohol dehydrogenase family)
MGQLDGVVALIRGGGSGLGRAVVGRFVSDDLCATSEQRIQARYRLILCLGRRLGPRRPWDGEAFGKLRRIYDAHTRTGKFDQILSGFQIII